MRTLAKPALIALIGLALSVGGGTARADWAAAGYDYTLEAIYLTPADDTEARDGTYTASSTYAWTTLTYATAQVILQTRRVFSWIGPGWPISTAIHFEGSMDGDGGTTGTATSTITKISGAGGELSDSTDIAGPYSYSYHNFGNTNTVGGVFTGQFNHECWIYDGAGNTSTHVYIFL
jgi:hypothetical protein